MAEKDDEIALDSTGLHFLCPKAHTKEERDAILDREAEVIRKGMKKGSSSNKSSPCP
jgi:hypothetical protein